MVRNAGAREVHLRISCPPTISPCFYGVDTPSVHELIAANNSIEEIRRLVEADTAGLLIVAALRETVADQVEHNIAIPATPNYLTELVNIQELMTAVIAASVGHSRNRRHLRIDLESCRRSIDVGISDRLPCHSEISPLGHRTTGLEPRGSADHPWNSSLPDIGLDARFPISIRPLLQFKPAPSGSRSILLYSLRSRLARHNRCLQLHGRLNVRSFCKFESRSPSIEHTYLSSAPAGRKGLSVRPRWSVIRSFESA